MARFPKPVPNLVKGEFDARKKRDLMDYLASSHASLSAVNSTPAEPVEIQAGVAAALGTALGPANALHGHAIETAAPSVKVALGGTSLEGTGTALMRADAKLILSQGTATDGQILVWDTATSSWVAKSLEDIDILVWMGL